MTNGAIKAFGGLVICLESMCVRGCLLGYCWERVSWSISALTWQHKNGRWARNTLSPREKGPTQTVLDLPFCVGTPSLGVQRMFFCVYLKCVHHMAPGQPHRTGSFLCVPRRVHVGEVLCWPPPGRSGQECVDVCFWWLVIVVVLCSWNFPWDW